MEKKVFYLIGERCKSIKYVVRKDLTDVQLIIDGLKEAAKNDNLLKMMLRNKSIVLQRPDPDRNNKMCDKDETDKVPDKSEITVLLVQNQEEKIPQSTFCGDDLLPSGQAISMNLKVLYEEPTAVSQQSVIEDSSGFDDSPELEIKDVQNIFGPVAEAGTSEVKTLPPDNSKTKLAYSTDGPGSIPNPAPLTPLTFDLSQKLLKAFILSLQRDFIYFWGTHLWQATHGQSTKRDYDNLATSIVAAYHTLGGGMHGCGIVRTQLSTWIRNRRANNKKKLLKRDHSGNIKSPVKCVVVGASQKVQPTEEDIKKAEKDLEKKHRQPNAPHVKRLLEVTLKPRRRFIEKEASSMSEILAKYPQLQEYEMMIFELLTLKKLTMETLFENINVMIEKLANFFSVSGDEESKASIMTSLCDALTKSKSAKSTIPALFTVQEVCSHAVFQLLRCQQDVVEKDNIFF